MLLYLIGPSGVGRTTLALKAQKNINSVSVVDVDDLIKEKDPILFQTAGSRWNELWSMAHSIFVELESKYNDSDSICLVDVGAGCLQTQNALPFFQARDNVVLIYDTPQNTFKKIISRPINCWRNSTLSQFKSVEYTDYRQNIYKACRHCVNIEDLSEQDSVDKFSNFINDLSKAIRQ